MISAGEPRGTVSYGYSSRDEVTGVTEPTGSPFADQAFGYDASYNRSSWTLGTTTTNYTVDGADATPAVTTALMPTNIDVLVSMN